jgi:Rod binding domain-containing protein
MMGGIKSFPIDPTFLTDSFKKKAEHKADPSNPDSSNTRLREAAKEIEALFFYEMLKELRKTTQGGLMGKGLGNDVYNSLFDMELARLLSGRGIGLKEMILKQVEKRPQKDGVDSQANLNNNGIPSGNLFGVVKIRPQEKSEALNANPLSLEKAERNVE